MSTTPTAPLEHRDDAEPTTVRTSLDAGVATVRIDRPEAFNALDTATKQALLAALTQVSSDPQVRVVVLTGTGRSFCAGEELRSHAKALLSGAQTLADTSVAHSSPIATVLAAMERPVSAAINGIASGAGLALSLILS